jgi:hypothetical protein
LPVGSSLDTQRGLGVNVEHRANDGEDRIDVRVWELDDLFRVTFSAGDRLSCKL